MKKYYSLSAIACLSFALAHGALSVQNVHVDSIASVAASYGNVWTGIVTYDCIADSDSAFIYLEFSSDGGATWNIRDVQVVGHVYHTSVGTNKKIRWRIDYDEGPDCRFRVRANDSVLTYTQYFRPSMDTIMDSVNEFPKPTPEGDPYQVIERMLNDNWYWAYYDRVLFNMESNYYTSMNTLQQQDFAVNGGQGEVLAGTGWSMRPYTSYTSFNGDTNYRYTALYLKVGDTEYGMLSKTSIRNCIGVITEEKKAVSDSLGIPVENLTWLWDHTHYTDNGESGPDSAINAFRRAKANARPVKMAAAKIRTGLGYTYNRGQDESGATFSDGPIDDNLWLFFFRDTAGSPIGSIVRFTGHPMGASLLEVQRGMEQAFGGCCLYMNGGSGTSIANSAKFNRDFVVGKALDTLPHLEFKTVDKMAVAHDWMGWNYGGAADSAMVIQAVRIGDYYFTTYGSEFSVEQSLYTNARAGFNDVIVTGYGNCGLCGSYFYWGSSNSQYADVYNMSEQSVRAINILRGLF